MNKVLTLVLVLLIIIVAGYFFFQSQSLNKQTANPVSQSLDEATKSADLSEGFSNPKKSAHYETNTPNHGAVLAAAPINVVIDFNFDLASPSDISIKMGGVEYGVSEVAIDQNERSSSSNKLAMRKKMDPNAPDGLYTVTYNACWPDKSCHDGYFQFKIDRSLSSEFEDQTGKDNVKISMSKLTFDPKDIKISKGTNVTWINDEEVEHYVNTDSHPAHTYYPDQNSKVLKKGEKFSLTFDTPGIYPYHCSAHEDVMKGNIIVE